MPSPNTYEILVFVSNDFQWELRPFFYFFDKHWDAEQRVTVLSSKDPGLGRADYVQVRAGMIDGDWHFGRFSDGLIGFLEHDCDKPLVALMNADYWLSKPVDIEVFDALVGYMLAHPEVTRMAISVNGKPNRYAVPLEKWRGITIMGCPPGHRRCFFPMSLLPAIYSRELWLEMLKPGWNPWEVETRGDDAYTADENMLSLTVDRPPVEYHHAARTRSGVVCSKGILEEDWEAIKPMIPGDFTIV